MRRSARSRPSRLLAARRSARSRPSRLLAGYQSARSRPSRLLAAGPGGPAAALATAGIVVVVDQASKQIAIDSVARGDHTAVFPGLDISNTRNTGVAFGALQGGGTVVAVLIALSLALLLGYFAFNRATPWLWLPTGMLVGGALGNLADRTREGAVIDFIDPVAWPAFNVADACIVVGVAGLLYTVERRPRRRIAS